MQDMKEKVLNMLQTAENNCNTVAKKIAHGGNTLLVQYLVQLGVEHVASKFRAHTRREQRRDVISPTFVQGKQRPSILTPKDKQKVAKAARSLFQTWKIGEIGLGEATKTKLLMEAEAERHAGAGHLKNAVFYEKLAAPMADNETVAEHWENEKAVILIKEEVWRKIELEGKLTRGELQPPA